MKIFPGYEKDLIGTSWRKRNPSRYIDGTIRLTRYSKAKGYFCIKTSGKIPGYLTGWLSIEKLKKNFFILKRTIDGHDYIGTVWRDMVKNSFRILSYNEATDTYKTDRKKGKKELRRETLHFSRNYKRI